MTILRNSIALLAMSAMLGAGACAPGVQNITVATPGPITSAPDVVTIVVLQPTTRLHTVELVDGRGQLVGQLDGHAQTVVHVPEGPTVLYAVLENRADTVDRVEGTLVPGRVYYATVSEREGGVALLVLSPRRVDGAWEHKNEDLSRTPRVQMDPQRIGRAVNELGDTGPIIQAGEARAAALDPAQIAARTFQESDGL
ncbi:MAG TPA: hypothetical protein VH560_07210 [Polyangia bacterium]|jgi:hypothetical protein|nr:hypothetical protein [Polyangia bacterium]